MVLLLLHMCEISFLTTHADINILLFYFRLHDLLSYILYAQIIYFLEL